ncbi:MAG: elongation factor G [Myxococcota bacterium]|nr:elongation factor G [Myxococcota bacterium]
MEARVSKFNLDVVRNIGIAAHIDAGKTTLTERILFYTGANHRIGEVHDGSAHMDWQPEEQEHGITITTAVTRCPWRDHLIQVVDTPGHVDFTIEVERAMRVLDGAVIVMDGVRGVEPQTETVWRQANKFDIPRLIFINKMDRPGASLERCMDSLSRKLKGNPIPVCVPVADGNVVLDLINEKLIRFSGDNGEVVSVEEIPASHMDEFTTYRETMLLAAAEANPDLEDAVMEEEHIAPDALWAALKKATLEGNINPVFGGSALRNWGVQPLLDGVLKLLPAPLERPATIATDLNGEETFVEMEKDEPLVALAFKVQMFDGRRHVFVRVYRGTLKPSMKVSLAGKDKEERVARVFDINSSSKKRIDAAVAGQIVVLAGLRHATTGDTLCAVGEELFLESIDAREPVLGLAIEPESSRDEAKMLEALRKVCEEDPTLRFEEDPETGQRILSGMGELHLQIIFERLVRENNLKLRAGKPRVVSRETIAGDGRGEVRLDRLLKLGEKEVTLKARAVVTASPLPRDTGITFTADPVILPEGVSVNDAQREAMRLGVSDSLVGGPSEGAPLQDVEVHLTEVEIFEDASSPQALRIAVSQAVHRALVDAGGRMLRPLMRVEVVVPDESMGSVLGDLQSRGASITGQESEMEVSTIHAECPLNELLGYTTKLRSMTRGRGQFTMEFARFDIA